MYTVYALHDYDNALKRKGAFVIKDEEALRYNEKGYGIFWLINDFEKTRKQENITKINGWICDIDDGSKEEQMQSIKQLVLQPSMIVESKNGYHCYWWANDATKENYKVIEEGIIERVGGDKHCIDASRILRMPCFCHYKEPDDPYYIEIIENNYSYYNEAEMLHCFRKKKEKRKKTFVLKGEKGDFVNEKNWKKIFKYDDIVEGNRNAMLARYTFWMQDEGLSDQQIRYIIEGLNSKIYSPLPQYEIDQILRGRGIR